MHSHGHTASTMWDPQLRHGGGDLSLWRSSIIGLLIIIITNNISAKKQSKQTTKRNPN